MAKADKDTTLEGLTPDQKIIQVAKKRFQYCAEAESDIRKQALDDLQFLVGDQWPDGVQRQRQQDGRPCLTINKLPQFVHQVTNDQRQNRPSIQINPVDDKGDIETAEVIQGIIRHIENDSGADAAYDTAFSSACAGGFGYIRVITEYAGVMSFEQNIKILRVLNPFMVYLDPSYTEPDGADAKWGFVMEDYTREDYKEAFPDSELTGTDDWRSVGDGEWVTEDNCRVVEYFYKESKDEEISLMSDGSVYISKNLPDILPSGPLGQIKVVSKRTTQITRIHWVKMNGVEILERTDWPGIYIPIIPVLGDEYNVDGKRILKGIVRDAKDPQRQYNYMASAATEGVALAPKAPFVAAAGQLEGFERDWQQANVKNQSVLQYKPVVAGGQMMPPPQRMTAEPAIQAINLLLMHASDDMKATTGIYDASLGARSNETSGKGILARQGQSQTGNFHFVDNLSRAIRHLGRVLLDIIPKVYDTQRVMRIIGEDGTQKVVGLSPAAQRDQAMVMAGVQKIYDITVGEYDVTISTGPGYQTKRQEAVVSQLQLAQSYPPLMGIAGDLIVKNMDWPGAQKISERLHQMLPPQLQSEEDTGIPPQAQQQIAQLTQQLQQAHQVGAAMAEDLKSKISQTQMELESKERIEFAKLPIEEKKLIIEEQKIQASLIIAQSKIDAGAADAEAKAIYARADTFINQAHDYAMNKEAQEYQDQQRQAVLQAQNDAAQTAGASGGAPPPTNGAPQPQVGA